MKNKTKIVIGASILSLSLCTALATGIANIGQLFAENETQSEVKKYVDLKPGDQVIFGGDEYTVLDPAKGTIMKRQSIKNELTNDRHKYTDSQEVMEKWHTEKNTDSDDFKRYVDTGNTSVRLPEMEELYIGNIKNFIPNLGSGVVTWTSTDGTVEGTKQVLNYMGSFPSPWTYFKGYLQDDGTCKISDEKIPGADGFKAVDEPIWPRDGRGETSATVSWDIKQKYSITEDVNPKEHLWTYTTQFQGMQRVKDYIYDSSRNCAGIYDTTPHAMCFTSPTVEHSHTNYADIIGGPISSCPTCGNFHPSRIYKESLGQANKTLKSYDLKEGDECNKADNPQATAHLRPVVTTDLSNVLFTTGSEGKPMKGDPQNEVVSLTMYDPDITLTIPEEQKQPKVIMAGEPIELDYSASTGSDQKIKVVVWNNKTNTYYNSDTFKTEVDSTGKLSILTGTHLRMGAGSYTLYLYNEESTGENKSSHASAITEIPVIVQRDLKSNDYEMSGNKIIEDANSYNENGVTFTISNDYVFKNTLSHIRVGTLDELNNDETSIKFVKDFFTYNKEGIYARKQTEDGYDYSDCLHVQFADTETGEYGTTIMLPIDSLIIDAKDPYFPSGKNGEAKPITIEKISKKPTGLFNSRSGPGEDIEENYSTEHTKLIPHANDYTANMYNGNTLKPEATPIENGIKSYKLEAAPLTSDGKVDTSKEVIKQTIQTADEAFKDCEPYFELEGKDAFWIKVTAVDQAGRETTIEQKLYMNSTQPAVPTISAVLQDGKDTAYAGGEIKNEDGELIPNWSGSDIRLTLSLSDEQLREWHRSL